MSDSEEDYQYYDYGRDIDDEQEIVVSGGVLGNGNAYATVKKMNDGYIRYHEYGHYAFSRMYRNHYLDWKGDHFNIEKNKTVVSMTSWASHAMEKDGCLIGLVKGEGKWYKANPNTMEKGEFYGTIEQYPLKPAKLSVTKPNWATGGFMEQDGKMMGMIKKTGFWYFMDPVTMAKGDIALKR
tara:strand:- start:801 stop:1346 length:546 start_codon:yes stop_codon:yes gene_type:complete